MLIAQPSLLVELLIHDEQVLIKVSRSLHNLSLRGLMCIPQRHNSEDAFYRMQSLFLKFKQDGFNIDTLSMGMSADFHQAIRHMIILYL